MSLVAPFPWFGGKRAIASEVWTRFGAVDNYVEPFAGSLAVLLGRPTPPGIETVNDLDGFLVNFWRAVASDPEAVAYHADWPISECDLHARHAYLVTRTPWITERLMGDPSFCDPKLAGWWVWGQCSWIGTGWCSGKGPWISTGSALVRREDLPHLGDGGRGINRKLPHLGDGGEVGGWTCQGEAVRAVMRAMYQRLRAARITCGDWRRVLTPVVTWRHGLTGIFLDPPYTTGAVDYAAGGEDVARQVGEWCAVHGEDRRLRIALCGHDGEHDLPGWSTWHWKARGGYGNQGGEDAEDNRHREVVHFSPGCLSAAQTALWGEQPAPFAFGEVR